MSGSESGRSVPVDGHTPSRLAGNQVEVVRRYRHAIVNLPHPDIEWQSSELNDNPEWEHPGKATLDRFRRNEIVEVNGTTREPGETWAAREHQVKAAAYERAKEYIEKIDTLPCCPEGTGFQNIGRSDWFLCSGCGECVHSRSLIEEVVL